MKNDSNIENPMVQGNDTQNELLDYLSEKYMKPCVRCGEEKEWLKMNNGVCEECQDKIEHHAINILINYLSIEQFAIICEIWEIDKQKIKSKGAKL